MKMRYANILMCIAIPLASLLLVAARSRPREEAPAKAPAAGPLDTINDGNADRLGLCWIFDIPTVCGMQTTPLMIDRVLYVSGAWSRLYAFNAASGELLVAIRPESAPRKAAGRAESCGRLSASSIRFSIRVGLG